MCVCKLMGVRWKCSTPRRAVPQRLSPTPDRSSSTPGRPRRGGTCPRRDLGKGVGCSLIHKSKNLETAQVSTSGRVDKTNIGVLRERVFPRNKGSLTSKHMEQKEPDAERHALWQPLQMPCEDQQEESPPRGETAGADQEGPGSHGLGQRAVTQASKWPRLVPPDASGLCLLLSLNTLKASHPPGVTG